MEIPAIEDTFEEETVLERIIGLTEMFPEKVRSMVGTTYSKSTSCLGWMFSATRSVTWIVCSTAAILLVPLSLEKERLDWETQMKRQERNIILGPDSTQVS